MTTRQTVTTDSLSLQSSTITQATTDKLETKYAKHAKFDKNIKKVRNKYIKDLKKARKLVEFGNITLKMKS